MDMRTVSQEHQVLSFFAQNPHSQFTPEDICEELWGFGIPLTSVRRAFTNLGYTGMLVKTDHTKEGDWGRQCHLWKMGGVR